MRILGTCIFAFDIGMGTGNIAKCGKETNRACERNERRAFARMKLVIIDATMAKIHSFFESDRFQIKLLKFRIIELSSKINTLNKFFFLNMIRNCYHYFPM